MAYNSQSDLLGKTSKAIHTPSLSLMNDKDSRFIWSFISIVMSLGLNVAYKAKRQNYTKFIQTPRYYFNQKYNLIDHKKIIKAQPKIKGKHDLSHTFFSFIQWRFLILNYR